MPKLVPDIVARTPPPSVGAFNVETLVTTGAKYDRQFEASTNTPLTSIRVVIAEPCPGGMMHSIDVFEYVVTAHDNSADGAESTRDTDGPSSPGQPKLSPLSVTVVPPIVGTGDEQLATVGDINPKEASSLV